MSDFILVDPAYFIANRFANKVMLITGGAHGIGRAIGLRAGCEGGRVVVSNIDETAGQECADAIRAEGGQAAIITKFSPSDRLAHGDGLILDPTSSSRRKQVRQFLS